MPQFELIDKDAPEFADLDLFTQGYVEAMFWTESAASFYTMDNWHDDETQEAVREGQSDGVLPCDAGFADLHPTALAAIIGDCVAFQKANAADLVLAYDRDYSPERAGHDYWLTRNGHGTGFWDRDELEADGLGERLSESAREDGEPQVWFADHVEYGSAPFVYHA